MCKYKFFEHKECEYYPCHQLKEINCMFCYCAAYPYFDCPGNPQWLKNGIKDCSSCSYPHVKGHYDDMMDFIIRHTSVYEVQDPQTIKHLYLGWNETMIYSYLDGCQGKAYVDSLINPMSAMILVGDFCFFAGKPNQNLVYHIKQDFMIICYLEKEWEKIIEQCYQDQVCKHIRYATKKDTNFDREKLKQYIHQLPDEYQIKEIDEEIYHQLLIEDWSKDLCIHYHSYDEMKTFGKCFVICYGNQIVSGAGAYAYYKNGIEIEIDTHPSYRKKGLARVIASQLILECLQNDCYPSWDAHNQASLNLAMQLGYEYDGPYQVYLLKRL